MMRKDSKNDELYQNSVPEEMIKALTLEARIEGQWQKIAQITENRTRLIPLNFPLINTTAVRVRLTETYGKKTAKLFEIRAYS
jgi:hypothetical protein